MDIICSVHRATAQDRPEAHYIAKTMSIGDGAVDVVEKVLPLPFGAVACAVNTFYKMDKLVVENESRLKYVKTCMAALAEIVDEVWGFLYSIN